MFCLKQAKLISFESVAVLIQFSLWEKVKLFAFLAFH